MNAAELKKQTGQLFADIYAADRRLQVVDKGTAQALALAAITFDIEGRVVVQGAQLYQALVDRRAPVDALQQALITLEPRAAKLGALMRQPPEVLRLTREQRATMAAQAPRSSSQILTDMEEAKKPTILKDVDNEKSRKPWLLVGALVFIVGAIALTVFSLPSRKLGAATVTFGANSIPCTQVRAANSVVFCVVDVDALQKASDSDIYTKMHASLADAQRASYLEVAFLKPGVGADGEQHRYRPDLWQRDPRKVTTTTAIAAKKK
jgi:hypothetical protein